MKTITVMRDGRPATAEELNCAVDGKPLPPLTGSALVRCPFCSNYPTLKSLRRDKNRWHVRCVVCGARGPHTNLPESALEEWNYRKPNDQIQP